MSVPDGDNFGVDTPNHVVEDVGAKGHQVLEDCHYFEIERFLRFDIL